MGLPKSYHTAILRFTADQRNAEGQARIQTLGEYYANGINSLPRDEQTHSASPPTLQGRWKKEAR